MTNEQLKNRAQQIIDAIPVLKEKEYGWAEIEKMLNEILIELDDSPWHTGTPTEEGWYLCKSEHMIGYDIGYYAYGRFNRLHYFNQEDITEWQEIEP